SNQALHHFPTLRSSDLQMSSEEIRELEITAKFQEVKHLLHIYPELIELVALEIKSHADQQAVTDDNFLDLMKETIATSIQEGIKDRKSTRLNSSHVSIS